MALNHFISCIVSNSIPMSGGVTLGPKTGKQPTAKVCKGVWHSLYIMHTINIIRSHTTIQARRIEDGIRITSHDKDILTKIPFVSQSLSSRFVVSEWHACLTGIATFPSHLLALSIWAMTPLATWECSSTTWTCWSTIKSLANWAKRSSGPSVHSCQTDSPVKFPTLICNEASWMLATASAQASYSKTWLRILRHSFVQSPMNILHHLYKQIHSTYKSIQTLSIERSFTPTHLRTVEKVSDVSVKLEHKGWL